HLGFLRPWSGCPVGGAPGAGSLQSCVRRASFCLRDSPFTGLPLRRRMRGLSSRLHPHFFRCDESMSANGPFSTACLWPIRKCTTPFVLFHPREIGRASCRERG